MLRNAKPNRATPIRTTRFADLLARSDSRPANDPGQVRFQRQTPPRRLDHPSGGCRAVATMPQRRSAFQDTARGSVSSCNAAPNDRPRMTQRPRGTCRVSAFLLPAQANSALAGRKRPRLFLPITRKMIRTIRRGAPMLAADNPYKPIVRTVFHGIIQLPAHAADRDGRQAKRHGGSTPMCNEYRYYAS